MKATGIVRRIEACVIIGQTAPNPHKHWVFTSLPHPTHWCQNRFFTYFSGAEKSALFLPFAKTLIFQKWCGKIYKTMEYKMERCYENIYRF